MKSLLLCISALSCLGLSLISSQSALLVRAEEEKTTLNLRLSSSAMTAGNTINGVVSLDSLENVGALDISIYFDPAVFTVTTVSELTSPSLSDYSLEEGHLRYNLLFGNTKDISASLFRFYLKADASLANCESYVEALVEEAYDQEANPIDIQGMRQKVVINEKVATLRANLYGTSSLNVQYGEEISLSYTIYGTAFSSGTFSILYDYELFEVTTFTAGSILKNAYVDANTELTGEVSFSFISLSSISGGSLCTLKFRPLTNATNTSNVVISAKELITLDTDPITCASYSTRINQTFNPDYVPANADISVIPSTYEYEAPEVEASITLGRDSHLGAGDFTLTFDPDYLELKEYVKGFSPTFFLINDKSADEGILKFSIISTTDIVDAVEMLNVAFTVKEVPDSLSVPLLISGNSTYDSSSTNPITLNYVSSMVRFNEKKYLSTDFAVDFLTATGSICAIQDDNNLEALTAIWDDLAASYASLAEAEKAILRTCDRNFENSSLDERENAMGRYAFLVCKYHLDNFIGMNLENLVLPSMQVLNHDRMDIHPLVVFAVATAVLGGLIGFGLIQRKRKNQ